MNIDSSLFARPRTRYDPSIARVAKSSFKRHDATSLAGHHRRQNLAEDSESCQIIDRSNLDGIKDGVQEMMNSDNKSINVDSHQSNDSHQRVFSADNFIKPSRPCQSILSGLVRSNQNQSLYKSANNSQLAPAEIYRESKSVTKHHDRWVLRPATASPIVTRNPVGTSRPSSTENTVLEEMSLASGLRPMPPKQRLPSALDFVRSSSLPGVISSEYPFVDSYFAPKATETLRLSETTLNSIEYDSPSDTSCERCDHDENDDGSSDDAQTCFSHFSVIPPEIPTPTRPILPQSTALPLPSCFRPMTPSVNSATSENVVSAIETPVKRILGLAQHELVNEANLTTIEHESAFNSVRNVSATVTQMTVPSCRSPSPSSYLSMAESDGEDGNRQKLVNRRRAESSEPDIPGRYQSICSSSQLELSTLVDLPASPILPKTPRTTSKEKERGPEPSPPSSLLESAPRGDRSNQGSCPESPSATLSNLLSKWEKRTSVEEVPREFIEQLRLALSEFQHQKSFGGEDADAGTSHVFPTKNSRPVLSHQDRCKQALSCEDQQQGQWSSPGSPVRNTFNHVDNTTAIAGMQWTPFSERSRVIASRQITPIMSPRGNVKSLSILGSSSSGISSLSDSHVAIPPPRIARFEDGNSDTVSVTSSLGSVFDTQRVRRRKNLQAFFGSGFRIPQQPSQVSPSPDQLAISNQKLRRDRKTSVAFELTKSVMGFRLPRPQHELPNYQEAGHKSSSRLSGGRHNRHSGKNSHHRRHSSASSIGRFQFSRRSVDRHGDVIENTATHGVRFK